MSDTAVEIASQPACWRQAAAIAPEFDSALPRRAERVAVIGCGTSLFMARAYAGLRESLNLGETDAFPASEMPLGRTTAPLRVPACRPTLRRLAWVIGCAFQSTDRRSAFRRRRPEPP